jgi:tryptophan-rich sensory protein
MLDYLIIILPSIIGFGSSMICNVQKDAGSTVSFRPPPFVFSIVWPILYILLGFSWYYCRKINKKVADVFYLILNLTLALWIFVYSCKNNKKYAIYVLLLAFIFAMCCYTLGDTKSKLMIVPLIGWILFATLLNIFEVQNISSQSLL